jgi:hypothetical protein
MVVEIEVLVLGRPVPQSPYAVDVVTNHARVTNWRFGSVGVKAKLSEDGRRVTKTAKGWDFGAIADGAGCEPLVAGRHYWEVKRVVHGEADGSIYFGVCRPGVPVDQQFSNLAETWVIGHCDPETWALSCNSCSGTGCTASHQIAEDEWVGLLLDLDDGGTLTIYRDNIPCGTIAEGLVGPLLPCISFYHPNASVRIQGNLKPPQ